MKTTKELARELGFLRKRTRSSTTHSTARDFDSSGKQFDYLIIIDFESTCWQEGKFRTQEIIEFPAVLLNTRTGAIDSEFHHYVQPQEQPILSSFCTELTGITQDKVEGGIPVSLCLKRFSHWLQTLRQTKGLVCNGPDTDPSSPRATCVTWSDWDLSVCLHYECKRKQINKPQELTSWIDLRATYRNFYERKPNGLNGALQDLGITFEGREHSGIADARNTANLAWRMIRDGCQLKVTKSLKVPEPPKTRAVGIEKYFPSYSEAPISTAKRTKNSECVKSSTNDSLSPSKIPVRIKPGPISVHVDQADDISSYSTCASKQTGLTVRNTNIPQGKTTLSIKSVDKRKLSPCKNITAQGSSLKNDCFKKPSPVNSIQSKSFIEKESPFKTPSPVSKKRKTMASLTDQTNLTTGKTPFSSTAGGNFASKQNFRTPSNSISKVNTYSTAPVSDMMITPPLCTCGKRSKRRMTQSPGPNFGRFFFTCSTRQVAGSNKGCRFFKWETSNSPDLSTRLLKQFTPVIGQNKMASTTGYSIQKKSLGVRPAAPFTVKSSLRC